MVEVIFTDWKLFAGTSPSVNPKSLAANVYGVLWSTPIERVAPEGGRIDLVDVERHRLVGVRHAVGDPNAERVGAGALRLGGRPVEHARGTVDRGPRSGR